MIEPTLVQRAVREAPALDLLVVAPAGCGKTEAIALRVAGLIERGQVPWPNRVLVATFSNRARDNIGDRLRTHVGSRNMREKVALSNFHGLSARIFRAHASVIGMDPGLRIPESDWVGEQCRLRKLGYDRSNYVQRLLRELKQESLDDAGVDACLVQAGDAVALSIERQRVSEGRLTYDDLPRVAELILQNDRVADLYRAHFACVMVDEFQDLSLQQVRIINRIGYGRTTYAGDLAQGIYGFAGAAPEQVFEMISEECAHTIEFSESHRSSPVVLSMVNALRPLTQGHELTCALPDSWPDGGLAGRVCFDTAESEAAWVSRFAALVLSRAPGQRIGVIARTAGRRRFVDDVFRVSGTVFHRWDDGILDTDTARIVSGVLEQFDEVAALAADDIVEYLKGVAGFDLVSEPGTREALVDALTWCADLLREGERAAEIKARIRIGDASTLVTVPGVHLLTGHIGKGQQFDWVVVVGNEEGCIPDFRAKTPALVAEEARVLSVMISRARHGVLLSRASSVKDQYGRPWSKQPSTFNPLFDSVPECLDRAGIVAWLKCAQWPEIAVR